MVSVCSLIIACFCLVIGSVPTSACVATESGFPAIYQSNASVLSPSLPLSAGRCC